MKLYTAIAPARNNDGVVVDHIYTKIISRHNVWEFVDGVLVGHLDDSKPGFEAMCLSRYADSPATADFVAFESENV